MNKELLQERKKMIYDFICDELYVPMKAKEMAIVLNVPKSQRGELMEVLDALVAEGKVEISGRGKYVKSEGKYLTGVFTAHPRGFGFVTVEGEEEDIFIPGIKLWWRSQIMEKTAKSRREKSLRSSDISTIRGQTSCPL